jgi:type-F conjugative transfer system pilin assembly protein TrbC
VLLCFVTSASLAIEGDAAKIQTISDQSSGAPADTAQDDAVNQALMAAREHGKTVDVSTTVKEHDEKAAVRALAEEAARKAKLAKTTVVRPNISKETRDLAQKLAAEGKTRSNEQAEKMRKDGWINEQVAKSNEYALTNPNATPVGKKETEDKPPLDVEGRVVVALSSSMPQAMLQEYFAQLDGRPEAIVVLRGAIGGLTYFKPTATWVAQSRKKDPLCKTMCEQHKVDVIIDPLLYHALGITKVPAVVYLHGVADIGHCEVEDYKAASVVYGATSVSAALKAMRRDGVVVPETVMKKFDPRGWEERK